MVAHADSRLGGARTTLMVRPAAFGFNAETAGTNVFQRAPEGVSGATVQRRALAEFDALAGALDAAGVGVMVVEDATEPPSPDAIFACNWVTFHPDGTVIFYPMYSPVRRRERRPEIVGMLERMNAFDASRVVDLSIHETESRFLEGSGSLVFDHAGGAVYASLSPRTDAGLVRRAATLFGYDVVAFACTDGNGVPVYHTDVVLALGRGFAVVAAVAIAEAASRAMVLDRLRSTGREPVPIDFDQVSNFAGNILEVADNRGNPVIVMSSRARAAFHPGQLGVLERCGRIVDADLSTIESVGGGSARCMIADVPAPASPSAKNRGKREPGPGEG